MSAAKPLTKDLLLSKCKTDKLSHIKNVNLWGNDLDDLSILGELPNVEIVSLSLNKIASLKDFSCCSKLAELYLRKNLVHELSEVQYLQKLQNLRVLWLSHNPCAE
jgi:Leucine-rich repeat (LRR) protein